MSASTAKGEWSEPVNLEVVNSPYGEKGPCISPDGKRLYFSRGGHPENISGYFNIWYSDWDGEKWGPPKNLGPEINEGQAYDPCFTPDGKVMYFHSGRPGGFGNNDIYYSEWDDTKWGPPKNLGPEINTTANEWTPSISADGNTIYYLGEGGLWVAKRVNGVWQKGTKLGPEINAGAHATCPWITLDGKEFYFAKMIFDKEGPGAKLGEHFMWVCEVAGDKLGAPVKIPGKVNVAGCDACCPSLTPDGKTMFFASERPGGKGRFDIWVTKRK